MTDDLAAAALALARRFGDGATLWTVAPGWPAHGRHVAVEFVHPVIVGKRALPTIHIDDPAPAGRLRALCRPGDVVLGIGPGDDREVAAAVRLDDVTGIWIGAGPRPPEAAADHVIWTDDPVGLVLLYHLLWELTHVVLEHEGPAGEADAATDFLYPFLDNAVTDTDGLLADLAESARRKQVQSRDLQAATLAAHADRLRDVAADLAARFRAGARLFTFGNGGSATDAETAARLFQRLPALSLTDDRAVLTALANDVGFELVFSRQLIAHARPGDIAMGFSTSGGSPNVLRAFTEARRLGLTTVGFAGYDGGAMAAGDAVEHCFVVGSDSVHRIQEAQAALTYELATLVRKEYL